jgi:hypothetical protein
MKLDCEAERHAYSMCKVGCSMLDVHLLNLDKAWSDCYLA